jgi:formate-dependent nitrite reductase cytochrome c552 subunit
VGVFWLWRPAQEQQAALSDEIKKIRFLYHYVLADGSLGVHNPEYARAILAEADDLITSIGR